MMAFAIIYLASFVGLFAGFALTADHTIRGPFAALLVLSNLVAGVALAIGAA